MTWQKIHNKYKDSELMKEFEQYSKLGIDIWGLHIKDIWGYLICFAETKEIQVYIRKFDSWQSCKGKPEARSWDYGNIHRYSKTGRNGHRRIAEGSNHLRTPEQAMLWCADKFFEVANGKT